MSPTLTSALKTIIIYEFRYLSLMCGEFIGICAGLKKVSAGIINILCLNIVI